MTKRFVILFLLIATYSFAENLTPLEKQIADTAKQSTGDAITFLEKVVNINSGTMKAYSKEETELHHVRFRACRDYYIEKWGGLPHEERFAEPFNGQPDPGKLSF